MNRLFLNISIDLIFCTNALNKQHHYGVHQPHRVTTSDSYYINVYGWDSFKRHYGACKMHTPYLLYNNIRAQMPMSGRSIAKEFCNTQDRQRTGVIGICFSGPHPTHAVSGLLVDHHEWNTFVHLNDKLIVSLAHQFIAPNRQNQMSGVLCILPVNIKWVNHPFPLITLLIAVH